MSHSKLATVLATITLIAPASAALADEPVRVAVIDPEWAPPRAADADATAPPPPAEPEKKPAVSAGVETGVFSTYVVRGVPQYVEKYHPSSQSTAFLGVNDVGPGTLSVGLFTAIALTDHAIQPGTGVDMEPSISYGFEVGEHFAASLGYTATLYPESTVIDGSHEAGAQLSFPNEWLTPFVQGYGEFVRQRGGYVDVGVQHAFEIDDVTVTPSASVGAAGAEAITFDMQDTTTTLTVAYKPLETVYVKLVGTWAVLLRQDSLEKSFEDRSTVLGGAAIGYAP
ncbi:MAG: hypothetical protein JNL21_11670 [Myxococcales bacterium]|nr:hypothetical protein [Myxococcales bacterium]